MPLIVRGLANQAFWALQLTSWSVATLLWRSQLWIQPMWAVLLRIEADESLVHYPNFRTCNAPTSPEPSGRDARAADCSGGGS